MSARLTPFIREMFALETAPSVVRWAESNLVLPRKMSPARPGPFSTERQPTSRPILECWHPTSGVRSVANVAGAQTAKTTEGVIGAAYRIVHSPMPMLIMGPSEDWLRLELSEKRIIALIEANPCLARLKPSDQSRFRKMAMEMAGGTISLEGANSPVATAGSTQGIVWVEEAAKIEHQSREDAPEAHPIKLGFERTKAFRGMEFHYLSFTPNQDRNLAWQYYLAGTQTHFYLPCPHCGEWWPFEFEVRKEGELQDVLEQSQNEARPDVYRSLVWSPDARQADGSWNEDKVRETCVYVCPKNGCEITEEHRMAMVSKFETRDHNEQAPKSARSFRRPSFYSPSVTFGDMAIEFLKRGDLFTTGLQNYYNSWLAQTWTQMAANVKEEHILRLRGSHGRGVWPTKPLMAWLTCDPGEVSGAHWMLSGYTEADELIVIDWGSVVGHAEVLNPDFSRARQCPLANSSERVMPALGYMDAGHDTENVYNTCEASKGFWWPVKGNDNTFGTWRESKVASRPWLRLYLYSDTQEKDELYLRMIQKRRGTKVILPADADSQLVMQLAGQQKDRSTGKWKKVPNDHLGDCLKYGNLAKQIGRVYFDKLKR